jgi:aquaporin Z
MKGVKNTIFLDFSVEPLQDFLCSSGTIKRREHPQCDRAWAWQRWNTFLPEQRQHERCRLVGWKTTQQAGGNMKKYFAELVGTFILVLFGCGTAVVAGDKVGILGIAFAFGLALVGAAYGIGSISGCHINPAVSLGVFVAGRMSIKDLIGYWVGQFLGGVLAAWVLSIIISGVGGGYNIAASGLGQDGWGPGYQGGFNITSAIVFEFVATMIFVIVILGSTQEKAPTGFAGLAIGITLVAIHIFGIHITGVSVNPARSLGPALLVGGQALAQVWLFLLVPSIGGAAAGLLFRTKALEMS